MGEDFFMGFGWLEFFGTLFGLTQVLLARKNNIHNYLFGIASILLGMWVLYHAKLYADMLLNLYYLVMSVYGWVYWKYGRKHSPVPISYSDRSGHWKALAIVFGCFSFMLFWLKYFTNSDVPYWDAGVSAFAWAGMWLMAKRKMENWIYLNISNLLSIPLLFHKELYIYAAFSIFLFILGCSGYLNWRKILKNEKELAYTGA